MAVTFDAVGPSAAGTHGSTSPLTWSHTNNGNAIVVAVQQFSGGSNNVTAVSYGGTALAFLAYIATDNQSAGGIALYGLASNSLPAGVNTVSVSFSVADDHIGGSLSFAGAASLGTAVTAYGNGSPGTVSVPSTTTGGMVAMACAMGSGGTWSAASGGTLRWSYDSTSNSGSDNAAGGTMPSAGGGAATTAGLSSTATDYWGLVAVEVIPSSGVAAALADSGAGADHLGVQSTTPALNDSGSASAVLSYSAPAYLADSGSALDKLATAEYITGIVADATGGHFVTNSGKPRMYLADNPWALVPNAGRWGGTWQNDIDSYVTARGSQGFTALYIDPLGCTENNGAYADGRTWDGIYPFIVNGTAGPITSGSTFTLNDVFWSRVDRLLADASAAGITVYMNIGYDGGTADMNSGGALYNLSSAQYQSWGANLAGRYAATGNIGWVVGNDYFGDKDASYSSILSGLRSGGDAHTIMIHNYAESTSRYDTGSGSAGTEMAWGYANSQVNFCYTYNVNYLVIEYAYTENQAPDNNATLLPVIWGDGYFYASAGTSDPATRQAAWWSLASGARGVSTGSEEIWQWTSSSLAAATDSGGTRKWYDVQAGVARTLIESLPGWYKLVPDTSGTLITAGRGTKSAAFTSGGGGGEYTFGSATDKYVAASWVSDGSLALIYFSVGAAANTITVDTTKMQAGYTATWVDPSSGAQAPVTPSSTYTASSRGNNSAGQADWVLVLQGPQAAAAALPETGAGSDAGPLSVGVGRPVTARGWVS